MLQAKKADNQQKMKTKSTKKQPHVFESQFLNQVQASLLSKRQINKGGKRTKSNCSDEEDRDSVHALPPVREQDQVRTTSSKRHEVRKRDKDVRSGEVRRGQDANLNSHVKQTAKSDSNKQKVKQSVVFEETETQKDRNLRNHKQVKEQ